MGCGVRSSKTESNSMVLCGPPNTKPLAKQESNVEPGKKTCNQRYGETPNADPDVRAQTAAANLERYAPCQTFLAVKSSGEKIESVNLERVRR